MVPQVECAIERSLAAHGRQDRIWPLFGDDLLNCLPGNWFDIGDIGRGRVGHDRGRVAVDQNDFVALFAQSLASLHAGVIEFASLTNDDRTSANNEDAF